MAKIYPIVVKRSTVVVESGSANAVWSEEVNLADPTMNDMLLSGETDQMSDAPGPFAFKPAETVDESDAFTATAAPAYGETVDFSDAPMETVTLFPEAVDASTTPAVEVDFPSDTSDYKNIVLADAPLNYWRLNDAASPFADLGSSPVNLTAQGSPTLQQAGLAGTNTGKSVTCSTNNAVTSTYKPSLGSAFTAEVWFKLNSANSANSRIFQCGHGDGSDTQQGFQLYTNTSLSQIIATVRSASGHADIFHNATITTGVWHHFAVTYDGSTIVAYYDGVRLEEASLTGTVTAAANTSVGYSASYNGDYVDGKVTEAAIYSTALDRKRIYLHYLVGILAFQTADALAGEVEFDATFAPAEEVTDASDTLKMVLQTYKTAGDSYTDQNAPTTNHGTATDLLAKGKSTLANDETRVFIQWDLTKFAQMQGDPDQVNSISVRVFANGTNSLGLGAAVTATFEFRSGSTQPFTEGSITWNNQPSSYGTQRSTGTFTAPSAAADVFIPLSTAQTTNALNDGWLLLIITTAGGASPSTAHIASEETASFPYVNFHFAR